MILGSSARWLPVLRLLQARHSKQLLGNEYITITLKLTIKCFRTHPLIVILLCAMSRNYFILLAKTGINVEVQHKDT